MRQSNDRPLTPDEAKLASLHVASNIALQKQNRDDVDDRVIRQWCILMAVESAKSIGSMAVADAARQFYDFLTEKGRP